MTRVRKQRSKQNKAKNLFSNDSPAYQSTCSLGNAVQSALKKLSLQFNTYSVDSKPKAGPTALPEETKSSVIKFLIRNYISCQAPGKRNTIVVRSNGHEKIYRDDI